MVYALRIQILCTCALQHWHHICVKPHLTQLVSPLSAQGGKLQVPSWCLVVQLLHSVTGQPPQERLLVAICGITKLFVGDLIETGG